jgi:hypothetical protein
LSQKSSKAFAAARVVPELMTLFGCSQRNALRVVKMSASTYLYKPVKTDDQALTMRITIRDRRHHAAIQVRVYGNNLWPRCLNRDSTL